MHLVYLFDKKAKKSYTSLITSAIPSWVGKIVLVTFFFISPLGDIKKKITEFLGGQM